MSDNAHAASRVFILPPGWLERITSGNLPPPPTRWAEQGEQPDPQNDLVMWVIHNRLTSDYPGLYVMRRCWVTRTEGRAICVMDPAVMFHHDIEPLRAVLPPGLYRMPHQPGEDFTIEETWL